MSGTVEYVGLGWKLMMCNVLFESGMCFNCGEFFPSFHNKMITILEIHPCFKCHTEAFFKFQGNGLSDMTYTFDEITQIRLGQTNGFSKILLL